MIRPCVFFRGTRCTSSGRSGFQGRSAGSRQSSIGGGLLRLDLHSGGTRERWWGAGGSRVIDFDVTAPCWPAADCWAKAGGRGALTVNIRQASGPWICRL